MKLTGSLEGIAILKALHRENKEYLKFLVGEAKSNFNLRAHFKDKDGKQWTLKLDMTTGDLDISSGEPS